MNTLIKNKYPKGLPNNSFWKFSAKIYSNPLVEKTLLKLQNQRGVNVNILLYCCWYAFREQGRMSKQDLKKILLNIQIWHERIVLPLRRIRQRLKGIVNPSWAQKIRQEILNHELVGEQIEQLIIVENFVYQTKQIKTIFQKMSDACKNIATYCNLLHISVDIEDCEDISILLATIFSKIDQKDVLQYCIEHLATKEIQSLSLTAQLPLDL